MLGRRGNFFVTWNTAADDEDAISPRAADWKSKGYSLSVNTGYNSGYVYR